MPIAVCHLYLKLSTAIFQKAAQEGLSRQILEGLAIRDIERLMINLFPFPAFSRHAQLCLSHDTGVAGGVRQRYVRQSNPAIKKQLASLF